MECGRFGDEPSLGCFDKKVPVQWGIIPGETVAFCESFQLRDEAFRDLVRGGLISRFAVIHAATKRARFTGRTSSAAVLPGASLTSIQRALRLGCPCEQVLDLGS